MKSVRETQVGVSRLKNFFQQHMTYLLTGLVIIGLGASIMLGILLIQAIQTQRASDRPVGDLLGPKYAISDRSKRQIDIILSQQPNAVGAFVIKYKFGKHETPIIHTWARPRNKADLDAITKKAIVNQEGPNGLSSDEQKAKVDADPALKAKQLKYTEEAGQGLIKCIPLDDKTIQTNPELKKFAEGICYATIPPFDPNAYLAIIIITDVKPDGDSPVVLELRRMLLLLQIDIFNRDFQGRETWAHP